MFFQKVTHSFPTCCMLVIGTTVFAPLAITWRGLRVRMYWQFWRRQPLHKIAAITAEPSAESALGLPKMQSEIEEFAKIARKREMLQKSPCHNCNINNICNIYHVSPPSPPYKELG